ncbi:MAG: hypothetical protein GC137_03790 [Alphaproteobacteria bacterium]|nr:hypothetical protein [Alphaproteobacteria bacterium]
MSKKYFFSAFLLFVFAIISLPQDVFAQIVPDGVQRITLRRSKSLLPRDHYNVEFYNDPQYSENLFIMRLFPSGELSGCANIRKGSAQTKLLMEQLELKVADPSYSVSRSQPRYSHYDCDLKIGGTIIDIPLDRDELINGNIKKIALQSRQYGEFMTSELKISKEKLELFTPNNEGGSLVTFWFFSPNDVILHVPNAPTGVNVQNELREFAQARGLVPLEQVYEDFELPYNALHYALFKNDSSDIAGQLNHADDYIKLGTIEKMRILLGADGPYQEPFQMDVIARLPKQNRE